MSIYIMNSILYDFIPFYYCTISLCYYYRDFDFKDSWHKSHSYGWNRENPRGTGCFDQEWYFLPRPQKYASKYIPIKVRNIYIYIYKMYLEIYICVYITLTLPLTQTLTLTISNYVGFDVFR